MNSKKLAALLLLLRLAAWGQTAIDLRTQSKDVDFGNAASTRPSKTGTALPGTCNIGETFFLTTAVAGNNWYGCAAASTWSVEGGSGGSVSVLGLGVIRSSATQLSIGSSCSASTPCVVRFGSVTYAFVSSATVTVSGGTGVAYLYIDSDGILTVGNNVTLTCGAGCVAVAGVTAFPVDSIPLFTWTASFGSWDAAGGTDRRAILSQKRLQAGTGIAITELGNVSQVSVQGGYSPLDASSFTIADDFCGGDLRWLALNGASTSFDVSGEAAHPCLMQLTSAATSSAGALYAGQVPPNGGFLNPGTSVWELHWLFRLVVADTNTEIRLGLASNPGTAGGAPDRAGLRFIGGTDTTWVFESCLGGTCATPVSSGVASTTGWVHFRMRGDATGRIYYCLDACASEQSIATNLPTAALDPYVTVRSVSGAATRSVLLDWFGMQQRGLAR